MGNTAVRETRLVEDALRRVSALLPAPWQLDVRRDACLGDFRTDAIATFSAPNGTAIRFVVEAKRSGVIPVGVLTSALTDIARRTGRPVLFVSDYISPPVRDALTDLSISYADTTGWVHITSSEPLVYLSNQGAPRSPRTAERNARVTVLTGVATNRIIRALIDAHPPIGVRALAARAGASPGSVSKLLPTLVADGIVDRDKITGAVTAVRKRALIQRWARDYSYADTNDDVRYFIAPRGLERTIVNLAELSGVIVTGSAGARELLPETTTSVVPLRLLALDTANPDDLGGRLGLIEADPTTANVVIARPQDPRILTPTASVSDRVAVAPVALVLADLLTLPGRGDAEAEQLMDTLARDDPAWSE